MTKLEKTVHIFLIGVCCLSTALLLERRFAAKAPIHSASSPALEGKPVNLKDVEWTRVPLTVILQLSPSCHFCQASVPFYRQLAQAHQGTGHGIRWLVTGREPAGELQKYLTQQGIAVDAIVRGQLEPMNFGGTPALFVVDQHGILKRAYLGRLSPSDEQEVLTLFYRGAV